MPPQRIMSAQPPPQLSIVPLTTENLPTFRRLLSTLLPIRYPDAFYNALLEDPSPSNFSITRVAVWAESTNTALQVVGGIVCRIQERLDARQQVNLDGRLENATESQIYIAALAVLAPWRGVGIATALMDAAVDLALELVSHPDSEPRTTDTTIESEESRKNASSILEWRDVILAPPTTSPHLAGTQHFGPITLLYAHVWEANDGGLEWYRAKGFEIGDIMPGYYRKLNPNGARIVRRGVISQNVKFPVQKDAG